jgi:hypothetical protein
MTTRLAEPEFWRLLDRTARQDGPASVVALLHSAVGEKTVAVGPAGMALAPAKTWVEARRAWPAGATLDPTTGPAGDPVPAPLRGTQLVVVRAEPGSGGFDSVDYRGWLLSLSWLRLGVSAALLDRARSYLSGRLVGGQPLLSQQLVKGALADAVTEQVELRAALVGQTPARLLVAGLVELHQRINGADRVLLRLLGARGYLVDGPGLDGYVSELLADVYLPSRGVPGV